MTEIAAYLDVLLHGISLIGLSAALGGMVYIGWVLQPLVGTGGLAQAAVRRSLGLIAIGSGLLAGCQAIQLLLQSWVLADGVDNWPLTAYLHTAFARAGMLRTLLALLLCGLAWRLYVQPASRNGWRAAGLCAGLLLLNGAWLVHAVGRLEQRLPLMAITLLHQLGAVVWVGGIIHLTALWRLTRQAPVPLWPHALARFSTLAMSGVAALVVAGAYLGWTYIGNWYGLIGTAYGVMVLTKLSLLALALGLGLSNFRAVRAWAHSGASQVLTRTPGVIETELAVTAALLLAAALGSLPPAVDIPGANVPVADVVGRLAPHLPRLVQPPQTALVAVASSVLDGDAAPSALVRASSEFSHNMSGLLVLAIGVFALLEYTRHVPWARHWPLLFLGLAAFLFVEAEPMVWPLGPESFWLTLQAPAVLQHRLATLLVVGLGTFEWRVRVGGLAQGRWPYAFPLLCLLGGAILLSHSHTAFASRQTFLVEVSHAMLGLLALAAGCGRWLELRLPPADKAAAGLLWRWALVLAGLVLLFYQEPGPLIPGS